MKSLLVFAVVLFSAKSFAQIKYAPVFVDPCTNQVVGYGSTISDSNVGDFFDHGLFTTEYRLPKFGQYILRADRKEFGHSTTIFKRTEVDWLEIRMDTLEALNEFLQVRFQSRIRHKTHERAEQKG